MSMHGILKLKYSMVYNPVSEAFFEAESINSTLPPLAGFVHDREIG